MTFIRLPISNSVTSHILAAKHSISTMKKITILLSLFLCSSFFIYSQSDKVLNDEKMMARKYGHSVTKHSLKLANGKDLNYNATTGYTMLQTEDGKNRAKMFFIAYTKVGEKEPADRPITFAFNGGPGSSSVWLHMGALGPKRIVMTDLGDATPHLMK